ncbi:MAG TPA: hypothetical protein PLO67_07275 [Saprospiraceae bacterium]|nr:hypothetical protein [Saprospiraceae bacterium]HPI06859.1 hypothetical protein [Saprospiraceae bacterium]
MKKDKEKDARSDAKNSDKTTHVPSGKTGVQDKSATTSRNAGKDDDDHHARSSTNKG